MLPTMSTNGNNLLLWSPLEVILLSLGAPKVVAMCPGFSSFCTFIQVLSGTKLLCLSSEGQIRFHYTFFIVYISVGFFPILQAQKNPIRAHNYKYIRGCKLFPVSKVEESTNPLQTYACFILLSTYFTMVNFGFSVWQFAGITDFIAV